MRIFLPPVFQIGMLLSLMTVFQAETALGERLGTCSLADKLNQVRDFAESLLNLEETDDAHRAVAIYQSLIEDRVSKPMVRLQSQALALYLDPVNVGVPIQDLMKKLDASAFIDRIEYLRKRCLLLAPKSAMAKKLLPRINRILRYRKLSYFDLIDLCGEYPIIHGEIPTAYRVLPVERAAENFPFVLDYPTHEDLPPRAWIDIGPLGAHYIGMIEKDTVADGRPYTIADFYNHDRTFHNPRLAQEKTDPLQLYRVNPKTGSIERYHPKPRELIPWLQSIDRGYRNYDVFAAFRSAQTDPQMQALLDVIWLHFERDRSFTPYNSFRELREKVHHWRVSQADHGPIEELRSRMKPDDLLLGASGVQEGSPKIERSIQSFLDWLDRMAGP
ncbi:MAG: hypothetical protein ACXWP5_00915 [Bdellovibrionota bacterium]